MQSICVEEIMGSHTRDAHRIQCTIPRNQKSWLHFTRAYMVAALSWSSSSSLTTIKRWTKVKEEQKKREKSKHRECKTGLYLSLWRFLLHSYKILSSFYVAFLSSIFIPASSSFSSKTRLSVPLLLLLLLLFWTWTWMPVSAFIKRENEEAVWPHFVCEALDHKECSTNFVCSMFGIASASCLSSDEHNCHSYGTFSREIRYNTLPIKPNITTCLSNACFWLIGIVRSASGHRTAHKYNKINRILLHLE